MSKLKELIEKLCPEGVEYRKLSKLCGTITTGKLNANARKENGEYPFFTCDETPFRIDKYAFDEEAILISGNGSQVGYINYYNGKFNAYQRTYVIYNFIKYINVKFLLHYLRGKLRNYIMFYSKKGSIPYITLPMLENFIVPVPPLEIQNEIVYILENYTQFSTEILVKLSKELKARKKQYEYYKEKLLLNNSIDKWITLEELFDTRNGYTPSKNNKEYWENGNIPWFRMEDIRDKGRILYNATQYITEKAVKGKIFPKDSLIISTSATIGEYALLKVDSVANQRFTFLMLKEQYKDKFDIMFLYYYCSILGNWCKDNLNKGNFASVDMKKFTKFKIPLIPKEEQEKNLKS